MNIYANRAMNRLMTAPFLGALALGLLAPLGNGLGEILAPGNALQQAGQGESEQQGPPAPELPPLQEQTQSSPEDIQQEMIKLFHTVERKLEQVDKQLSQAGTGVLPLDAPRDAGLDDLLRGALQSSQDLTDDIDRMLELAQKMGGMQQQSQAGQQSQSGQPQSNPGGDSPIDNRNQGEQQSREQTPEGPQEQGGKQPGQESDNQKGDGKDQNGKDNKDDPNGDNPDGKKPDSDRNNPDSGSNRPGEEQAGAQSAGSGASGDANRWGELPVRVREVFRNQGREDLPVQYRDWIDAYYRRLNKVDR